MIPGDEVTIEYVCSIDEVKQLCQNNAWANATIDLLEPVDEADLDEGEGQQEIVYKRVSDVAQTLTEGFNAAVTLARHIAKSIKLLRDEEGTYYFSA